LSKPKNPYTAAGKFGLGPSRRDLDAIGDAPLEWLDAQLSASNPVVIDGMPSSSERIANFQKYFLGRLNRKVRNDADARKVEEGQREYQQAIRSLTVEEITRRFEHAVRTPYPVRERLALFWANHFTVSQQGRLQIATACASFENEAIRSNLDNHFTHMLLAVASNPVMLLYLDNAQSVGPASTIGRRRKLGTNENYAREVLELHTLGVNGGYTQADVIGLASMLTGWTVGNQRTARMGATPGEFVFVELMHQPGRHRLLGKDYEGSGRRQGVEALRDLSLHPATARHLATKLVRHFVADEPDARDVDYVANVYLKTEGHLPSVHKAVMTLGSAWNRDNRKLKTPYELLVSIFRGLDVPVTRPEPVLNTLRLANHLPFTAPSPAGWPDTADHWGSPAVLKHRVEFGIAAGGIAGNRINARDAARYLVDPDRSPMLLASIDRAASPAQGLSLLLSSPDFQWR